MISTALALTACFAVASLAVSMFKPLKGKRVVHDGDILVLPTARVEIVRTKRVDLRELDVLVAEALARLDREDRIYDVVFGEMEFVDSDMHV